MGEMLDKMKFQLATAVQNIQEGTSLIVDPDPFVHRESATDIEAIIMLRTKQGKHFGDIWVTATKFFPYWRVTRVRPAANSAYDHLLNVIPTNQRFDQPREVAEQPPKPLGTVTRIDKVPQQQPEPQTTETKLAPTDKKKPIPRFKF